MMQTKAAAHMVLMDSARLLEDKLGDMISALDYGASTTGSAATNTSAINVAIAAAASSGFVIVPPGISYTESSLALTDGVVLLVFSSSGYLTVLTKDQGTSLPVVKSGLVVKSEGNTGILLRGIDYGVSTEPVLQLLDSVTGDIAAIELKFTEFNEISDPTSAAGNKARLYAKDDGSGNTQLAVRFATGSAIPFISQGQQGNLTGSKVWDPASIADGDTLTTTLTVTGAALTNYVLSACSISLGGLVLSAYVSATDTVTLVLFNGTGAAVDFASATYNVLILRNW